MTYALPGVGTAQLAEEDLFILHFMRPFRVTIPHINRAHDAVQILELLVEIQRQILLRGI